MNVTVIFFKPELPPMVPGTWRFKKNVDRIREKVVYEQGGKIATV
jgi:hypothetical protein